MAAIREVLILEGKQRLYQWPAQGSSGETSSRPIGTGLSIGKLSFLGRALGPECCGGEGREL
jgi:hypothetical protein